MYGTVSAICMPVVRNAVLLCVVGLPMRHSTTRLLPFILLMAFLVISIPSFSRAQQRTETAPNSRVFLPLVRATDNFGATPALWAAEGAQPPPVHEVALLRCTLTLAAPLARAELALFADTRYEAWLNGTFIGRGPARFSEVRREYDVLDLGTLAAGRHVVAVLAQWAPTCAAPSHSSRRSRSDSAETRSSHMFSFG